MISVVNFKFSIGKKRCILTIYDDDDDDDDECKCVNFAY